MSQETMEKVCEMLASYPRRVRLVADPTDTHVIGAVVMSDNDDYMVYFLPDRVQCECYAGTEPGRWYCWHAVAAMIKAHEGEGEVARPGGYAQD